MSNHLKYVETEIDLDSIERIVLSKEFHLIFTCRGLDDQPDKSSLRSYGKRKGLGDIESSILSYLYHSLLVQACSCHIKFHGTNQSWRIKQTPNKIFNATGFKIYVKGRRFVNNSLLMISAKEPSIFSTLEYTELYNKLKLRVS